MKRLNTRQLDAVARKIVQDLREPVIDENNKLIESETKKFLNSKKGKLLTKASKEFPSALPPYKIDSIIRESYAKKLKKLPIKTDKILDLLIIHSIDCDDLDVLINEVKSNLNK